MRNFNRLGGDRGSAATVWAAYMGGYIVGSLIQGFLWYHHGYDSGKEDQAHSQTVQLENEQLQQQLDGRFDNVNKLILNDDKHTFTFDMTDMNGASESCGGKYQVSHEAATIVGNLACTQIVLPTVPGK